MSLDANYILSYDRHDYIEPTPMQQDMKFLKEEFGGEFTIFDFGCSIFWEKPKYTLHKETIDALMADRVLEKKDCDQWEIVK